MDSAAEASTIPRMDSICRTCLNESRNMKPIFKDDENDICKMLESCSGLNIHALDGFPTNICSICLDKVHIAYEFRQQCEISHNTFVNFMRDHPDEALATKKGDANVFFTINEGNSCAVLMDLVCRTCLNESNNMKSIFMNDGDNMLHKMLQSCTGLNIHTMDGSPTNICLECLNKVRISYKFRQQCEILLNFMGTKINGAFDTEILNVLRNEAMQTNTKVTNNFGIFQCEQCLNQYTILSQLEEHFMNCHSAENETKMDPCSLLIDNQTDTELLEDNYGSIPIVVKMECDEEKYTVSDPGVSNKNFKENIDYSDGDDDYHPSDEESGIENESSFDDLSSDGEDKSVRPKTVSSNSDDDGTQDKQYQCSKCSKVFTNEYYLRKHRKKRHDDLPRDFICEICNNAFTTLGNLKIHKKFRHRPDVLLRQHQCDQCNAKFGTAKQLRRHKATHLNEKPFTCEQCGKRFSHLHNKNRHMLLHSNIRPYECKHCDKAFTRLDKLRQHRQNLHGERKSKKPTLIKNEICKICQKTFSTPRNLHLHMKNGHLAEKKGPFLCTDCGSKFRRPSELLYHIRRRHNGETPYKCKVCGQGFARLGELTVHDLYHTGEKKHLCTICHKPFFTHKHLQMHVKRVHTDVRRYKCLHCDKRFKHEYGLKTHVRLHPDKLFECGICDKLIEGSRLAEHKRNKHEADNETHVAKIDKFITWFISLAANLSRDPLGKKHECTVCGKEFPGSGNLRRHLRYHIGEKPQHKCQYCEKKFIDESAVKRHTRRIHADKLLVEKNC